MRYEGKLIFMFRLATLVLCCVFAYNTGIAQYSFSDYELKLKELSDSIMMSRQEANRFAAYEAFYPLLSKVVKFPGSFNYPFDSLQRLSIMYPQDSSFRIFSGQLFLNEDQYKYFGAIQVRSQESELIWLEDKSEKMRFPEEEILTPDNWYGAVYYNIYDFDTPEGRKYLLFGFDNHRLFENRKVIDVLSFQNDQVQFGAPVFETHQKEWRPRMILQYSSDVGVRLNYDSDLQMIVYDNLIPMKSLYKGKSIAMVPDGSYRGLKYKDGKWYYIDKVFYQTSVVPPRENPVLSNGKDLFGRKKNK